MAHVKRDKKHEVVKPSDDCSCSSSDSSSSSCTSSPSSSSSTDCSERKIEEHCEVKRLADGKTHCKRKCKTICVYECTKDVHHRYEWCKKTEQNKEWHQIKPLPVPEKCHGDHHDRHDNKKAVEKNPAEKKHVEKKHVVKK